MDKPGDKYSRRIFEKWERAYKSLSIEEDDDAKIVVKSHREGAEDKWFEITKGFKHVFFVYNTKGEGYYLCDWNCRDQHIYIGKKYEKTLRMVQDFILSKKKAWFPIDVMFVICKGGKYDLAIARAKPNRATTIFYPTDSTDGTGVLFDATPSECRKEAKKWGFEPTSFRAGQFNMFKKIEEGKE